MTTTQLNTHYGKVNEFKDWNRLENLQTMPVQEFLNIKWDKFLPAIQSAHRISQNYAQFGQQPTTGKGGTKGKGTTSQKRAAAGRKGGRASAATRQPASNQNLSTGSGP